MNDKLSMAEMTVVQERVQIIGEKLLDTIAEAICDMNSSRRDGHMNNLVTTFNSFAQELRDAPFLSVDLSEIEETIDALIDGYQREISPILNFNISAETHAEYSLRNSQMHNHLGKAAGFKHQFKRAVKDKNFDVAWGLIEEIKQEYILHANYQGWDSISTMRLVASPFKDSANILRIEGRHKEALRHYLYYSIHSATPSKAQVKKLTAYLKRSKLPKASIIGLWYLSILWGRKQLLRKLTSS